jgi:hypothetical protein
MERATAAAGLLVLVVLALPAAAQEGCRQDGALYREGARLCVRGLVQLCVNGNWQNLDGERCDDDGRYLNPGHYEIAPDAVIEVPEPLPPPDWRPPVGGPVPLGPDGRPISPRP